MVFINMQSNIQNIYVFQKGVIKYRRASRTKMRRLILQNAYNIVTKLSF